MSVSSAGLSPADAVDPAIAATVAHLGSKILQRRPRAVTTDDLDRLRQRLRARQPAGSLTVLCDHLAGGLMKRRAHSAARSLFGDGHGRRRGH